MMPYFSALVINLLPIFLFLLVVAALISFRFEKGSGTRRKFLYGWSATAVLLLLLAVISELHVPLRTAALNLLPIVIFLAIFGGLLFLRNRGK
jgi:hypothetical protein